MVTIIILILSVLFMFLALRQVFTSLEKEQKIFSLSLFLSIMMVYLIVLIGFGIIYLVLYRSGVPIYQEVLNNFPMDWRHELGRSMYFSGATLFTVGYGDLIPVGIGRWVSIFESMIGYSIPAALVAKVCQNSYDER